MSRSHKACLAVAIEPHDLLYEWHNFISILHAGLSVISPHICVGLILLCIHTIGVGLKLNSSYLQNVNPSHYAKEVQAAFRQRLQLIINYYFF